MTSPYTRSHSFTNASNAANVASPRTTIPTVNMRCSYPSTHRVEPTLNSGSLTAQYENPIPTDPIVRDESPPLKNSVVSPSA
jgi:hypothetical protein